MVTPRRPGRKQSGRKHQHERRKNARKSLAGADCPAAAAKQLQCSQVYTFLTWPHNCCRCMKVSTLMTNEDATLIFERGLRLPTWRRAGAADTGRCAAQLPQPSPPPGVLAQREEGVHRTRPHQCAPAHMCRQPGLALYQKSYQATSCSICCLMRGIYKNSAGESGCSNLSEWRVACGRPADDGPLRGADAVASVASARQLGGAAAGCTQEEEGPAAEGPQEDVPPVQVIQVACHASHT